MARAGGLDSFSSERTNGFLKAGASALALCTAFISSTAWAQDGNEAAAQPEEAQTASAGQDEIIVTGIRESLRNAQQIKRDSDTVVDAITAQDIGALPDRSVTEALQRVPGVAINRFAGSNDPDHFSVEGSGVVIRGLSFVRSEFNGRDTFSTGVYGQSINFADVPSELLGSVEVYKNLTAEMIEGGLSGIVNLNTRVPFDDRGFHFAFSGEMNYGDFQEDWSPTANLLISNTWDTEAGRFGLLANVSYSQVLSRADGLHVTNFQTRDNRSVIAANTANTAVCRNPLPLSADTTTLPPGGSPCGTASTAGADGRGDNAALLYAPVGGQLRTQDYDRERLGLALAAQWESTDRTALLTLQYLRSESTNAWGEHTFEAAPDLSEYNTYPAGCHQNGGNPNGGARADCRINSAGQFFFAGNDRGNGYNPALLPNGTGLPNYQYDNDGVFEAGLITLPGTGWRTGNSGSAATRVPTGGMQNSLATRQVEDENVVADYGLNFRYTPDDAWQFNFDAQYVSATHDNLDVSVFGSNFGDQLLDITGDTPQLVVAKPLTLSATWAAPNPAMVAATDHDFFADRQWTFWRAAMDHIEHSEGEEVASQFDVAYNFQDDGFLRRLKFGARYADRDQTIRYTTYNWGAISEVWSGTAVFMDQAGSERTELYTFDNFFRGDALVGIGPDVETVQANYYSRDLIGGYVDAGNFFKSLNDYWHNVNGAGATNRWVPLRERPGVVAGTDFLPSEIQEVSETNMAGYAMLSFGGEEPVFGNVRLSGNVGVRYVNTRLDSLGAITVPSAQQLGIQDPFSVRCAAVPPPPGSPPGTPPSVPGGICRLGEAGYNAIRTWAGTGATTPDLAENDYDYFLPSLNLKFELNDEMQIRFAASRAIARPSLADVRNFITTSYDANTNTVTTNAGNPFLNPAVSDQLDLTYEWYFAPVGSITVNGFYKWIHNFFYQALTTRDVTSNGVTLPVIVRGPENFDGTGTVRGFELAYQQTYDFLPGLLSGLGMQASYTFIDSEGVPNSRLNNGASVNNSPIGVAGNLPLEQLSRHNINVAAFFERGRVSARLAYNWRSKFLLTSADVIFPYFPIFNDETGQLDASLFFSVTEEIKIGVQAVNLTNEVTRTLQQFTVDGLLGPRSYFMNDRRFSFIVRGNF